MSNVREVEENDKGRIGPPVERTALEAAAPRGDALLEELARMMTPGRAEADSPAYDRCVATLRGVREDARRIERLFEVCSEEEQERRANERLREIVAALLPLPEKAERPPRVLDVWGDPEAEARAAVADWKVTALGRRPEDHIGRDLLFGSLFRDERPTGFHRRAKQFGEEAPEWVEDLVGHLPGDQRIQAVQHIALNFLHQRSLLGAGRALPGGAGITEEEAAGMVNRLQRCWPYGAKVSWQGEWDRDQRDVCGLAWLCPWCHARKVMGLYDRLKGGPLAAPDEGTYLVLIKLCVTEEQFAWDSEWRWGVEGRIDQLAAGNGRGFAYSERGRLWAEVDCVRSWAKTVSRQVLHEAGVRDGLWAHQVGPHLFNGEQGRPTYRHEFAVLGEARYSSPDDLERLMGGLGLLGEGRACMGKKWVSVIRPFLLPASAPVALRLFLAGSSANYPVSCLPLEGHEGDLTGERPYVRDGFRGALPLQPVFMMDAEHYTVAGGEPICPHRQCVA